MRRYIELSRGKAYTYFIINKIQVTILIWNSCLRFSICDINKRKEVDKMIKFSEEEGFIKAHGIKFREGQDKNIKLPSVAVGVFSRHLFDDVIEKYSALEVGYFSCANMERNIYIIKYKDIEIVFFMAGVSGPWIAGDIELYSAGVQKLLFLVIAEYLILK